MKPYTDLMIDLETYSTETDAMILQIGWVFFNRKMPDRQNFERQWYPDLEEQSALGFQIDISTLQWWQLHPDAHQRQLDAHRQPLEEVVHEMLQAWDGAASDDTLVWAKGTHFDIPILAKIFPAPWHFRSIHDLRTAKLISGIESFLHNEMPHDALEDARAQAEEVKLICSTNAMAG